MFKAVALAAVALRPNREDGKRLQATVLSSGALKVQLQIELWIARPARISAQNGSNRLGDLLSKRPWRGNTGTGVREVGMLKALKNSTRNCSCNRSVNLTA